VVRNAFEKMAMLHFMNCMLLTFGPLIVLYRSSKLFEERALRSCTFAGFGFAATQIIKIFVMATFLPTPTEAVAVAASVAASSITTPPFHLTQELMKTAVNVIEYFGVKMTLEGKHLAKYEHHVRVLAVGLGWTFAESLILYLIPLWMGARGMEFEWEYVEMGVASNISLLLHIGFAGLVWLRTRTDISQSSKKLLLPALITYLVLPLPLSYLEKVQFVSHWDLLALRLVTGLVLGILTKNLLVNYKQQQENKHSKKK